jgi:hypothetical protein
MMCNNTSKGKKRGSRNYDIARKAHSEAMKLSNPMFDPNMAKKKKISGDKHYMKKKEWKEYFSKQRTGEQNPMFNRKNPSRYRGVTTLIGSFNSLVDVCLANKISKTTLLRYLKNAEKTEWKYID